MGSTKVVGDFGDLPSQVTTTRKDLFLKLLWINIGPFMINIVKGMFGGYSATLLPQLQEEGSRIKISLDEATWIASSVVPAMALGCILGGYVSEKFGRKAAHTWTLIPITISWLMIAFTPNVWIIIAGRFLAGLAGGISGPANSMYICETSPPKYRGLLQTSMVTAISIGILIVHIIGTYFSWETTALICAILPILTLIPFYFVPESPDWLAKKNKAEEAKAAIKWINGEDVNVNDVLEHLVVTQSQMKLNKYNFSDFLKSLKQPEIYKPLIVINFYFIIGQWSGNNMVCFYAVDIAKQSVGKDINEYLMVIIIDIVRIISSTVSCYVSKTTPVRTITSISGYGCAITLFGLALSINYSSHLPAIIPFLFILAFIFLVTAGLVPIPWNMTGEIFPLKVRDIAGGISQCIAYIAYFLLIKTGPFMFDSLGQIVTYSIYGGICFFGTLVLYFILPETYGKTLKEIQEGFKKKPTKDADKKCKDNLI